MLTAIDFETYYDVHHTVQASHVCVYVNEPDFDAYLVAIVREDGMEWVGHPKDFNWGCIKGDQFVAHNASFDSVVFERCQSLGIIPEFVTRWECTADLSRFYQGPRSLKGAAYAFFGETKEKTIRDTFMKGKHWQDIVDAGLADDVREYALDDARLCLRLWQKLSDGWPEGERELSRVSREMGVRGVTVDAALLDEARAQLERVVFKSEADLPWTSEYDAKYKKEYPPLSIRGLNAVCKKEGIEPPTRTAEDAPERMEWERRYGTRFPWVRAMASWRQANKHLKTLDTIKARLREDGTMPYGLKYSGADTTMRFSGDTGFNTQNMPRGKVMGVDIRSMFIPQPGNAFVICDLSQIEPRCLAYASGDVKLLKAMESGMSPYEAHARASMGYKGEDTLKNTDPARYVLAKARVLSLGYGASWKSFIAQVRNFGAHDILSADITKDDEDRYRRHVKWCYDDSSFLDDMTRPEIIEAVNAWLQVRDYRDTNKLVTSYWKRCDTALKKAVPQSEGSEFHLELYSGRVMRYTHLMRDGRNVTGFTQLPDSPIYNRRRKLYGSLIVENVCQGMARDIFCHHLRQVASKYPVVLQIHDEVVVEVPKASAEDARQDIERIMSSPVPWADRLPISAEAHITERFTK